MNPHETLNHLQGIIHEIDALEPVENAQRDPGTARASALAQAMNVIQRHRQQLLRQVPRDELCHRCRLELKAPARRWCSTCDYPGIDDDYRYYHALLEEGHPRHQAAVLSGWHGIEEYTEDP